MDSALKVAIPDPPPPSRAWRTVGLLWFVACFNYMSRIMVMTMHGSIVAAIPMTDARPVPFGTMLHVAAVVLLSCPFLLVTIKPRPELAGT
jgi:hypothetical protein